MFKKVYCPECGSSQSSEIIYGLTDLTGFEEELSSETIYYGGKIIREDGPHWLCRECKTAWCKDSDRLFHLDEFSEFVEIEK